MERLSMMSGSSRAIVGEPAPRFTCKAIMDGRIKDLNSRTYINNNQWVILIFFPMAWSFICPTEINAFSMRASEFATRDASVLFISTDSQHVLRAWNSFPTDEGGLGGVSVPLLSDRNCRIAKDYGVLIEEEGISQRAVFIIDPTGIIRSSSVNDANLGRSVDEVARLLDALKFSDEYGQGCPVDWKAGQKGINMQQYTDPEPMAMLTPGPAWTSPKATPPQTPPATSSPRPGMGSRGMSWGGAATWTKGTRPQSALVNGSSKMPSTPTGTQRPMSVFWGRDTLSVGEVNEEAVGTNGFA